MYELGLEKCFNPALINVQDWSLCTGKDLLYQHYFVLYSI